MCADVDIWFYFEWVGKMLSMSVSFRHMLGEDLAELQMSDLLQLEEQLDSCASQVRARKASIWNQ